MTPDGLVLTVDDLRAGTCRELLVPDETTPMWVPQTNSFAGKRAGLLGLARTEHRPDPGLDRGVRLGQPVPVPNQPAQLPQPPGRCTRPAGTGSCGAGPGARQWCPGRRPGPARPGLCGFRRSPRRSGPGQRSARCWTPRPRLERRLSLGPVAGEQLVQPGARHPKGGGYLGRLTALEHHRCDDQAGFGHPPSLQDRCSPCLERPVRDVLYSGHCPRYQRQCRSTA